MSAKLCGIEQRAPPIFGRAAIKLSIGSRSNCCSSGLFPSANSTDYQIQPSDVTYKLLIMSAFKQLGSLELSKEIPSTAISLLLWPPYGIGQAITFLPCGFYLSCFYLFSSPDLSGWRYIHVCMYVSFGQGSSLLWTHTLRPFYSRPIALTQKGRSLVNDVCERVRD